MKIVIAGAGDVGCHLARLLSVEYHNLTIIDSDEERLSAISESADVITVAGKPTSMEVLKEAGAGEADLFIAVSPAEEQDVNIVCAILAKKMGSKKVIARVNNEEYIKSENNLLFKDLGIDLLFYPEHIAAVEITDLLKQSGISEYIDFAHGKLQLVVYRLDEGSPVLDRPLSDFLATGNVDFRLLAVARDGKTVIAERDMRFKINDLVFVMATRKGYVQAMKYSGRDALEVKSLMILGGGRVGEMVARRLEDIVDRVKIIELNQARSLELSGILKKTMVVAGDGRNSDLLIEEEIKNYDAFVAVTSSSETNILSCVAAKSMGVPKVVAKVENNDYIKLAERMGVDSVINKKQMTAGRIFRFTMSNKVRLVKYLNGSDAEVLEFNVNPQSNITKGKIRDINFPQGAVIGGYIRKNESYIAVGDTVIEPYDRVVVFALPSVVNKVDKFFI